MQELFVESCTSESPRLIIADNSPLDLGVQVWIDHNRFQFDASGLP